MEDTVHRQQKYDDTHLHWAIDSQPKAVNRSSYLNEDQFFYSSVSEAPPPSFLLQTPLGTPHEETGIGEQRVQVIESKQQAEKGIPSYSQPVQERRKRKVRPSKKHNKVKRKVGKNGYIQRWIYEEVRLSMSKMSIMSLVLGLLFLGALFFIIGFLAAVSTLKTDTAHAAHSAWKASNTATPGEQGGIDTGPFAALTKKLSGKAGKEFTPFTKLLGKSKPKVPAPLQPFARYAIGKPPSSGRGMKSNVNPFHTRRGGVPQAQQPLGQPYGPQQPQPYPVSGGYPPGYPQGMPQGMYPPQGYSQGYSQGTPQGYPQQYPQAYGQPMPLPQGGNPQIAYGQGGYGQMPPHQGMQQPRPQRQAMPRRQMRAPQPQMVQQNVYQGQMAPQPQGYYR